LSELSGIPIAELLQSQAGSGHARAVGVWASEVGAGEAAMLAALQQLLLLQHPAPLVRQDRGLACLDLCYHTLKTGSIQYLLPVLHRAALTLRHLCLRQVSLPHSLARTLTKAWRQAVL
jgi:hypothetical protein